MQLGSIPNYIRQARTSKRIVFFTGSTAILKGMGVCYVADYTGTGTGDAATDPCGLRDRRVAIPSTTNNMWFAGVTSRDYLAVSGGQLIEIFEPGSICEVAIGSATVLNSTVLSCLVTGDPGRFTTLQGLPGRGNAIALQTKAAAAGPVLAASLDGTATCTADGLSLNKAALFANTKRGDKVIVLGGSSAAGVTTQTPGVYTIASGGGANDPAESTSVVVLTSSCAAVATAGCVNFIVIGGNPAVLCKLVEGPESGLVQWSQPANNVAASPAPMVGGMTYFGGGYTMGTGVSTFTVASGTYIGQLKGFGGKGTLTTNGMKVTLVGLKVVGTALAYVTLSAADHIFWAEWGGMISNSWCNRVCIGATEA